MIVDFIGLSVESEASGVQIIYILTLIYFPSTYSSTYTSHMSFDNIKISGRDIGDNTPLKNLDHGFRFACSTLFLMLEH